VKMTRGPNVALEPFDPVLCLLRFAKRDDFFVSHRVREGAFWCLVRRCFICDKPSGCAACGELRLRSQCVRRRSRQCHLHRRRTKIRDELTMQHALWRDALGICMIRTCVLSTVFEGAPEARSEFQSLSGFVLCVVSWPYSSAT